MGISRDTLIRALKNTYGKNGMNDKDIDDLCDFILAFFGYDDYVLDNVLSPPERDVFYNLEEYGIVSTVREEVNIVKGKTWRINQWYLNKQKIMKLAEDKSETDKESNIYDSFFKNM
ncbi:DUF6015 family protein [Picrophilus oshimae]|uniref:Uncharacterized protein n=1 Tax=Picrophilus torridus (strain ATCC 700027 / DSM 9790 / JCM 10055 / NBRC 100828 / KAW 2/3) TaxID=1122961 RepID=Q6L2J4_PICTO|nr:DUF6015 family protein [Picrophilus oshimae]AAT42808.1 hypothetical protein PTO0223 [Picrophilus oshimae DSM 9789]SMD31569.1 hypothetical protein SAMN02745355_1520 [Picrophilus oshimae DSM 9789]